MRQKVVALAGGTGSAKMLRGISELPVEMTVVANVGDNIWMHGLYVCPDVDIAVYTLAGISDERRGWGIEGDSFNALAQLRDYGRPAWFNIGDRDLATHLVRTGMLADGATLTEVTSFLASKLGVRSRVLPATDSEVETRVVTDEGEMHLQEYWVKRGGKPRVRAVKYVGASRARPTMEVKRAIADADRVVFCPANPLTSIGPILAIGGMKKALSDSRSKKVALSPMIGEAPFSGPAGSLLSGTGYSPDSLGVARFLRGQIDTLLIDKGDERLSTKISGLGVRPLATNTLMSTRLDERRLARELIDA